MADLAQIVVTSHDAPSQRHGRLLEVGYGLGISARAIQKYGVREHVLLEANIDVRLRAFKPSARPCVPAPLLA